MSLDQNRAWRMTVTTGIRSSLVIIAFLASSANTQVGWCDAGAECCTIPPCMCGTYVNCLSENCFSATCEICPEGYFCSCQAACARLGTGGFDLIEECPPGYFCPAFSGRPTACPAGTFQPHRKALREEDCMVCSSFWQQSGAGAGSCSLSTNAIIVIAAGSVGLVLCCGCVAFLWRRRRREEEDFYRTQAAGIGGPAMNGYYAAGGAGYEMKGEAEANGHAQEAEAEGGRRLTAEEKRLQLAERMQELEEEEEAMMGQLQQRQAEARRQAEAAKPRRKKKGEPKDPEDDVEVMV